MAILNSTKFTFLSLGEYYCLCFIQVFTGAVLHTLLTWVSARQRIQHHFHVAAAGGFNECCRFLAQRGRLGTNVFPFSPKQVTD